MIDGNDTNDTTHAPNGFVPASELYHVESGTEYPHPDQQATDSEIAEIFDFDRREQ